MRIITSLLVLALAIGGPAGVSAQEAAPAFSEPANAPFTAGLTDPGSLTRIVEARLAKVRDLLTQLLAVRGDRSVANTLVPYDEMWGELHTAATEAQVVAALHPDEAMRKAGDALNRAASALAAEVPLRRDVHDALNGLELGRADALTRTYVERELKELRMAGVDRPQATRERIAALRDELTQRMDEFQRNIRNGARRVVVSSARELDGLPADFIARHVADASGAITLTTNAVDARPVLIYARSADVRRRMLTALYSVAAPENVAVLDRILAIRYELAQHLGFANWASVDTASRMAGTESAVSSFIDRVIAAATPRAAREFAEIAARKRADAPDAPFEPWDRRYLRGTGAPRQLRLRLAGGASLLRVRARARRCPRRERHDVRRDVSSRDRRPRVAPICARL